MLVLFLVLATTDQHFNAIPSTRRDDCLRQKQMFECSLHLLYLRLTHLFNLPIGMRDRVVGGLGGGLSSPRSIDSISPRGGDGLGQLHNTSSHHPHPPFHGNATTNSHNHSMLHSDPSPSSSPSSSLGNKGNSSYISHAGNGMMQHQQSPLVAAPPDMDFMHKQQQLLIQEQQQLLLLERQQLQQLELLKQEQQQQMQQRQQQLLLKQLLLQQQPQQSQYQRRGDDNRGEYLGGDRGMGVPGSGARMGLGASIDSGGDYFDAGPAGMGRHGGGSMHNPSPSALHHPGSIHGNDRGGGGGEYMGGMGDHHSPNGGTGHGNHGGDASLIPLEYLCPMSSTLMFDPVTGEGVRWTIHSLFPTLSLYPSPNHSP